MAIEKEIKIKVDAGQADKSIKEVKNDLNDLGDAGKEGGAKAAKGIKDLESQAKKTEKSLDNVSYAAKDLGKEAGMAGQNGEAGMRILDEATGGLATTVKEVGGGIKTLGVTAIKAFKSAVFGANAMGKALIATGIGAIVVALGLIVAYWDDIVGLVSGVSAEQEILLANTEAEAVARKQMLDATTAQENSLKLQGMSEREIRDLKVQQTNEVISAMEAQLLLQKEQSDAQVKAMQRNKDIAQNFIRLMSLPLTILLGTVDAITKAVSKIPGIDIETNLEEGLSGGLASLLFDPEEIAEAGAETISETEKQLVNLKNQRDGFILQNQAQDKAARDKSIEDNKAAADKAGEDEINRIKALNDALLKLDQEKMIADAENMLERARIELEIEEKKALDELTLLGATKEQKQKIIDKFAAKNKELDDAAAEKEQERQDQIDAILKERGAKEIEDQFEKARAELEAQKVADIEKLKQAKATEDEINRIKGIFKQKADDINEDEANFKEALRKKDISQAASASSQILSSVTQLVGQGSKAGKAAAIASATIDTIGSTIGAYNSVVKTPFVGPVLAPIAAGVAAAAGLKSIKEIVKVKTPGGGGGGSVPNISTPSQGAQAPAFNLTASSGVNQLAGDVEGAAPVRAFVVGSDVTNQQEMDRATFGQAAL